jgi:hypothetical protein
MYSFNLIYDHIQFTATNIIFQKFCPIFSIFWEIDCMNEQVRRINEELQEGSCLAFVIKLHWLIHAVFQSRLKTPKQTCSNMNESWNERGNDRYRNEAFAYWEKPSIYLKKQLESLAAGTILFPAEGEGRNVVFAASLGWTVSAFDNSAEGKKKALRLAATHDWLSGGRTWGIELSTRVIWCDPTDLCPLSGWHKIAGS